jgi:hypothetical protein
VPRGLEDRVDVSEASSTGARSVVTVCEASEYPPPVLGRSAVLVYVEYVDDLRGSGLRKQIVAQLRCFGTRPEVIKLFEFDRTS